MKFELTHEDLAALFQERANDLKYDLDGMRGTPDDIVNEKRKKISLLESIADALRQW